MGIQGRDYYKEKLEKIEKENFEIFKNFDWKKLIVWFIVSALIVSLVFPLF